MKTTPNRQVHRLKLYREIVIGLPTPIVVLCVVKGLSVLGTYHDTCTNTTGFPREYCTNSLTESTRPIDWVTLIDTSRGIVRYGKSLNVPNAKRVISRRRLSLVTSRVHTRVPRNDGFAKFVASTRMI